MGMFLYSDHFNSAFKKNFYYLWIKFSELLLVFGYSFYLTGSLRKICFIVSGFYLIRFFWQLFEIADYEGANQVAIIDILFGICVFTSLVVTVFPSINTYFKKRYAKRLKNGGD